MSIIINKKITALIVAHRLLGEFSNQKHPRLTMETITANAFNNVHIIENFSEEIKVHLKDLIEKNEPIPIDTLLGTYSCYDKEIIIYEKAIELFSNKFKLNTQHVQLIVRLHEYAHAILHLGSNSFHPISDTRGFVKERTDFFKILPESFHECIAQYLCFSALCIENLRQEKETFIEMMPHLPKIYHVDTVIIENSLNQTQKEQFWKCLMNNIRIGNLKEDEMRARTCAKFNG